MQAEGEVRGYEKRGKDKVRGVISLGPVSHDRVHIILTSYHHASVAGASLDTFQRVV